MNEIIAQYKALFARHYGEGRLSTKDVHKQGQHVGWKVSIDGNGGEFMNTRQVEEAIELFQR